MLFRPSEAVFNIDRLCEALEIDVEDADLGASRGGCEAMLVPLAGGRFRIVVDAHVGLGADVDDTLRRRRRRFRIAHELGHTLFYIPSAGRPYRRFRGGGAAEEAFCDEFARCLLVPPPRVALTAARIVELHEAHDVSLELAARTAAASTTRPRVALWWWRRAAEAQAEVLLEQWVSDRDLGRELGILPYRVDLSRLPAELGQARRRLGSRLSTHVLLGRRQALAVLV